LPQGDYQERACLAALQLRDQLLQFDVRQQSLPLRTRVGLHAGPACVGNLGSATRFEYSAIGDNTNLASRLEGLNKQLGTEILASRDIQKHVADTLLCRLVGHFKFKGVDRLLEVHELIGRPDLAYPTRAWRETFGRALFHFQRRQFDEAEGLFKLANQQRKEAVATPATARSVAGEDGPSLFYLAKIAEFRKQPPPADWNGEIELSEK
jgi:adenylate cyclase